MPDIFLSYSRSSDAATARRFAEAFAAEGFDVWWDSELKPGDAFDAVIEQNLRDAKAVVVLWSKSSVASRWVRAEATLADRSRTLVPAMIEPCERPIMFELTHTADLSRWDGDAGDKSWQGLLKDVRRMVRAGGAPEAASLPSGITTANAPAANAKGTRPSLAILPFTNRSGEREDDYFATGMVDDIIAALSLSRQVKVIAQSATVAYGQNVSDLRAIGRDLGVRYILEGNLRRLGADLRVTTQLVEADSAAILWSQKFDRPLAELAYLQEDLVTEVAVQLGVTLRSIETEKALRKPGDITAYEALLRAHAANFHYSPDSLEVSIAEARKAITLAPDFAAAHAILASTLANSYASGHRLGDPAVARDAVAHAERSLNLASDNPEVLSRAAVAFSRTGNWSDGLAMAERAVELNPNLSHSRYVLGIAYIRANRNDDALAQLEAEAILAPRGGTVFISMTYRAAALFQAGRHDLALETVDRALALHPRSSFPWSTKVYCAEAVGRRADAQVAMRRCRALDANLTPDIYAARTAAGWCAPEFHPVMISAYRTVWEATPVETAVG